MTLDIYRCKPRQVRAFVIDVLQAGLVPYVKSSPGMGKSSIMRSICSEMRLEMIDHRLSTSAPEDLSGLPHFDKNGFARFAPFADLFPLEHSILPSGKDGWMLFLDEFPHASKEVQSAAYKLILDKMVGQHRLHERVVITCAGNLATDRAMVNKISTAMQSRVIHIEMQLDFEEWLIDVALKQNYDPRLIAYLSRYNDNLMDFNPSSLEATYCCPRTWEFVNRLIQGKDLADGFTPLLAGTITSGIAAEFVQFCQVFTSLVTIDQIVKDPCNVPVPPDSAPNAKWATIAHMMDKVDSKNFDQLSTYADRFDLSFRLLFYRGTMVRQPILRRHPAFLRAMSTLNNYLHGTV